MLQSAAKITLYLLFNLTLTEATSFIVSIILLHTYMLHPFLEDSTRGHNSKLQTVQNFQICRMLIMNLGTVKVVSIWFKV